MKPFHSMMLDIIYEKWVGDDDSINPRDAYEIMNACCGVIGLMLTNLHHPGSAGLAKEYDAIASHIAEAFQALSAIRERSEKRQ